jgi:hypothetical protein
MINAPTTTFTQWPTVHKFEFDSQYVLSSFHLRGNVRLWSIRAQPGDVFCRPADVQPVDNPKNPDARRVMSDKTSA